MGRRTNSCKFPGISKTRRAEGQDDILPLTSMQIMGLIEHNLAVSTSCIMLNPELASQRLCSHSKISLKNRKAFFLLVDLRRPRGLTRVMQPWDEALDSALWPRPASLPTGTPASSATAHLLPPRNTLPLPTPSLITPLCQTGSAGAEEDKYERSGTPRWVIFR